MDIASTFEFHELTNQKCWLLQVLEGREEFLHTPLVAVWQWEFVRIESKISACGKA